MRRIIAFIFIAVSALELHAQKQLYIPYEWLHPWKADSLLYKESDPDNIYTWSKSRSKESDNFICYWDKEYGKTIPTNAPATYRVDIDDLLQRAEEFYALNIGELGFCDESNSKVSQYKMMILLNHTTEWVCYGAGYDDVIGALWLSPSTCKPVGQSVAHEVGHSFQYQCFCDLGGRAGFRDAIGNGSTFWEQTAQWQSLQSFPELKWSQSWSIFHKTANYAMTHEDMRYQSYWWHYYLVERYGKDFIAKMWRHKPSRKMDPNEVLMDMMKWSVEDLYREYFIYAMRMATLDIEGVRDEAQPYIGSYAYNYIPLGGSKYQVDYSSCPQSTGFNVIPLDVPDAGEWITVDFVSLKQQSPYNATVDYDKRGFRLGFVALKNDNSREYLYEDCVYCAGSSNGDRNCQISCAIPENTAQLFLVVSPSPSVYFQHKWDDNLDNDDQFPYTIELQGTNISGAPLLSDNLPLTDATITYDVYFPIANDYSGTSVTLTGTALSAFGTAFQMQGSALDSTMIAWNSNGPSNGQTMFYPLNSKGNLQQKGSTANGYGHWFNASGICCDYYSGYVYSEFDPVSLTFSIGQYPSRLTNGGTYTIRQALKYCRGNENSIVRFIFRIHPTSDRPAGYKLVSVEQSEQVLSIAPTVLPAKSPVAAYTLDGINATSSAHGVTIQRMADGKVYKTCAR